MSELILVLQPYDHENDSTEVRFIVVLARTSAAA